MQYFERTASPLVLVTRPIGEQAFESLQKVCSIRLWSEALESMPRDVLLKEIAGVDAVLCLLTDKLDEEAITAAGKQLKCISTISVGFDHIDVPLCRKKGIAVAHTPDVLTATCATFAVGMMLSSLRRFPEAMAAIPRGEWKGMPLYWMTGADIETCTVGIVGFGAIGQAVARRLQPFGSTILYTRNRKNSPPPDGLSHCQEVELEELLQRSDIVTLHCPLNDKTKHLINKDRLAMMKSTALLVNASRGGCIDQDALVDALQTGVIGAAALDVTTPEPLPLDHPLLHMPNCAITPHISSATKSVRDKMCNMAVENVLLAMDGSTLKNPVPGSQ
jgi:lactate dehydrogenase-like 2-hydroxyacid dehydrogenase